MSELHRSLVEHAKQQGWETGDWRDALRRRLRQRPWKDWDSDLPVSLPKYRPIPDAFRFRVARADPHYDILLWVEFLEVEVSYQVPAHKMETYRDLWLMFDATARMELVVYRMDRYGMIRPLMDVERYYASRRG